MTQEEIIQGNKIIAEFMGYTYYPNDTLNDIKGVLRKSGMMVLHLDITKPFHAKYHSSWDHLMPVVEKIESLGFRVIIFRRCCDIQSLDLSNSYLIEVTAKPSKIEAAYSAVTQFIKWYNSQSPNQ